MRRVALQSASKTQDTFGHSTPTWSTYATVWAGLEPLTGRELIEAQRLDAEISHKITIRYTTEFAPTAKHRLTLGARVFNFTSVRRLEERNVVWEIMAKEDG